MNEYLVRLRSTAQGILAEVQRLEDLGATKDDDFFADTENLLEEAYSAIEGMATWIAEGRND